MFSFHYGTLVQKISFLCILELNIEMTKIFVSKKGSLVGDVGQYYEKINVLKSEHLNYKTVRVWQSGSLKISLIA